MKPDCSPNMCNIYKFIHMAQVRRVASGSVRVLVALSGSGAVKSPPY